MKYRPVLVRAAVADEPSVVKGNSKLEFTQRSIAEFAASPPAEKTPVMRAHGTSVGEYLGYVSRWMLSDNGRELHAVLHITRDVALSVGAGISLGIDHRSRISEASGHKRITTFSVRELSVALDSEPAMKSARILEVGDWVTLPDDPEGSDDLAARRDERGLSAWRAAGLPVGHSVGNYGGSVPLPHGTYSTRTPT